MSGTGSLSAEDRPAGASLWRDSDFVRLLSADVISEFGSAVTGVALPLTAVVVLSATPAQMGLLVAAGEAPVLLVGLLAGAWVDRVRRRPVMIFTDLARAFVLIMIPLAFVAGVLSMWQIYVVAALAGGLTVFAEVAAHSYLPSLLKHDQLVEGNSKLGATGSIAEVGGPSVGGILVQILSAPLAILIDAVSFIVSAVLVARIRKPEPPPPPRSEVTIWADISEGLRLVTRDPLLRGLLGNEATITFFGNFIGVSYNLYVINELGLSPAILGISIGMGGVGALLGAFLSGPIIRRFGLGPSLTWTMLYTSLACFGLLLAGGPPPVAATILLTTQLVGDVAWGFYFIAMSSIRQSVVPTHLLGRSSASARVVVGGLGLVGALMAGAVGEQLGLRPAIFIGIMGIMLSTLWFLLSPVRTFREQSRPGGN